MIKYNFITERNPGALGNVVLAVTGRRGVQRKVSVKAGSQKLLHEKEET